MFGTQQCSESVSFSGIRAILGMSRIGTERSPAGAPRLAFTGAHNWEGTDERVGTDHSDPFADRLMLSTCNSLRETDLQDLTHV